MSDTKFTKGEWLIAGDAFVYSLFHAGGAERNKFSFQGSADVDCPRDEMIANARLIASSPELYAALESMLLLWRSVCNAQGWEPNHVVQHDSAVAALKKARGKS